VSWKYMLDTGSVSYALRGQGRVSARLLEEKPSALCMSAITLAELRFEADRRGSRKLHRLIETFGASVTALPFDDEAATQYGRLAADLVARGTPIGAFDAMIAAHAIATETILVTNNAKHFGRVRGLRCENWV
jgi:tRNA(fMet)-specific endonuclease VapC